MICEPDGRLYPSARALPSLRTGIGHGVLASVWPGNPWSAAYRRDREDIREREAGWLSGSCLLVRRSAFEDVGGFDPGYFMYFEDVDLCDRLAKHGWSCMWVPTASVTHVGGTATGQQPLRMLKAHHDSAYRYLASRYRAAGDMAGASWACAAVSAHVAGPPARGSVLSRGGNPPGRWQGQPPASAHRDDTQADVACRGGAVHRPSAGSGQERRRRSGRPCDVVQSAGLHRLARRRCAAGDSGGVRRRADAARHRRGDQERCRQAAKQAR